ncbi:MAG TPA: tRNA (guanine(46)-N(7))-methyltransferase TrmB, partial [Hyphomicrobiales bacterium]|nr:tRNA (guanine(46)-N(7))-methyltransferase TrmB [Hyphomicrobiales bacterium]
MPPSDETTPEARGAVFGRRKGHPLRKGQAALVENLLPRLRLDLDAPAGDLAALFPAPVTGIWLEIGFGGGEHLSFQAARHPDIGFIGCEPFINGVAKLLAEIDRRNLANIRIHDGDACAVLDWLPEASIGRVFLLHPDPWPKKRHWKRRFVTAENLDRLARVT